MYTHCLSSSGSQIGIFKKGQYMGAKYELIFLTNKSNLVILSTIIAVINEHGWFYNVFDNGKYSYWKDEPIWRFGESVEVTEPVREEENNSSQCKSIIEKISHYFSPLITAEKTIHERTVPAIISIYESQIDLSLKEAAVSFDYGIMFQQCTEIQEHEISKQIKNIFTATAKELQPVYAVASLEMAGLVESPELLTVNEEMLGDFNYFSSGCKEYQRTNDYITKYESSDYEDIGRFIFTAKIIGKQ